MNFPAKFLDDDSGELAHPRAKHISSKKWHKVPLNKTETINEGKGYKYRTSTVVPLDETTDYTTDDSETDPTTDEYEATEASTSPRTSHKKKTTTTSDVPFDDHTTEDLKLTTEVTSSEASTSTKKKTKTTTSDVPFDDHTATTEAISSSTIHPGNIQPAHESHNMKWLVGKRFLYSFRSN